MKLSIILPVYKVEKYIQRCINSILSQTFSDFELIIIDDGSPDNCGLICDEFAQKDNRIKVIHKTNEGLGFARNAGLDIATGEYVAFIDSDDWIEKDMFEYLISIADKNKCDVVRFGWFLEGINQSKNDFDLKGEGIVDKEFVNEAFILDKFGSQAWKNIYRLDLFRDIRFPPGIYEDLLCIYKIILKAKRVYCTDKPFYHYLIREDNISFSTHPLKSFYIFKAFEDRYNFTENNYTFLNDKIFAKCIGFALQTYNDGLKMPNQLGEKLNYVIDFIIKNKEFINKSKAISVTKKTLLYLFVNLRVIYNLLARSAFFIRSTKRKVI